MAGDLLYRSARWVLRAVLVRYFRVRAYGIDRIPASGPVLLAINHLSMLDPLLIGVVVPRPVHFMAKEELFRYPVLRQLLPKVHAFPVRRGEADREAIHQALRRLQEGQVVGVFPEGTRSQDGRLLEIQGGTALLALKSGAPILPIAITGTERAMPRGAYWPRRVRVEIRVGKLIHPETSPCQHAGRDRIHSTSRRLAEELGALLEQAHVALGPGSG
ncbi:MAG: 1-acyl-sn-glycerol-3-phosphate acyltransferase [Limnochordaceae bacterium]|nr:1-acyl-sn-glycerol-3-phosphate acyltransferase [Limnochordaceae bacterium]